MNYVITPILLSRFTDMDKSTFVHLKDFGVKLESPLIVFLVQGNGRTILFDTGPVRPELAPSKTHRPMKEHISLEAGLKSRGVEVGEVTDIVLSHLHWDHCYNLELFPGVPIYVQGREVEHAMNPLPCHFVSYNVHNGNGLPQWLEGFEDFRILEGDHTLAPGLELVCLPGHTPGLQGLVVETAEGPYLLGSDHYPMMENYLQGQPSGIHTDVIAWQRSHEKVVRMGWKPLPAHDDCVFERGHYG